MARPRGRVRDRLVDHRSAVTTIMSRLQLPRLPRVGAHEAADEKGLGTVVVPGPFSWLVVSQMVR
jgi:hypothetical protein